MNTEAWSFGLSWEVSKEQNFDRSKKKNIRNEKDGSYPVVISFFLQLNFFSFKQIFLLQDFSLHLFYLLSRKTLQIKLRETELQEECDYKAFLACMSQECANILIGKNPTLMAKFDEYVHISIATFDNLQLYMNSTRCTSDCGIVHIQCHNLRYTFFSLL